MRFFIKNYGCQMNSYDSDRMSDILQDSGHFIADDIDNANIIVFNTCSIREKADDKLYSDLGRVRQLKEREILKGNNFIIVVAGCVAQTQSNDILKRMPYVDIVLGPQDIHLLVSTIEKILGHKFHKSIVSTTLNTSNKFAKLTSDIYSRNVSAFLTIQEGCDNFCTYCVVPHTRGREYSRDVKDILEEIKKLVDVGVKEIVLLGQNVNSYHGFGLDEKDCSLAKLLYTLSEIDGIKRIRYLTSNPKDINEDIAKAHRDIDKLMPFLHLPVQSGSNEILKRMNRKYSASDYLKCIDMIRKYRADMAFSSDFIVGFPGESDSDFEDTIRLIHEVQYAQAYSFKYSKRVNTPAATMLNQVNEQKKSKRLQILQSILNEQQSNFNKQMIGKTLKVLFTKDGRHSAQSVGRSEYFQAISVDCDNLRIGDIANVKITDAASHSLIGIIDGY